MELRLWHPYLRFSISQPPALPRAIYVKNPLFTILLNLLQMALVCSGPNRSRFVPQVKVSVLKHAQPNFCCVAGEVEEPVAYVFLPFATCIFKRALIDEFSKISQCRTGWQKHANLSRFQYSQCNFSK